MPVLRLLYTDKRSRPAKHVEMWIGRAVPWNPHWLWLKSSKKYMQVYYKEALSNYYTVCTTQVQVCSHHFRRHLGPRIVWSHNYIFESFLKKEERKWRIELNWNTIRFVRCQLNTFLWLRQPQRWWENNSHRRREEQLRMWGWRGGGGGPDQVKKPTEEQQPKRNKIAAWWWGEYFVACRRPLTTKVVNLLVSLSVASASCRFVRFVRWGLLWSSTTYWTECLCLGIIIILWMAEFAYLWN